MLLSTFHFRNAVHNPEISTLFKTITKGWNINPCCIALLEANSLMQLGTTRKQPENIDFFTAFKELRRETPQ